MDTIETWAPATGFEGVYEVSDLGRVRGVDRWIHTRAGRPYFISGRLLTVRPTPPEGYRVVTLCDRGEQHTKRVHRLVAEAFVPGRSDGLEVCHNNGDLRDNRAENLRWGDHGSNMLDVVRHGNHHNAIKTHCKHGHPFDSENTRVDSKGRRDCKACARRRDLARKARRRELSSPPSVA